MTNKYINYIIIFFSFLLICCEKNDEIFDVENDAAINIFSTKALTATNFTSSSAFRFITYKQNEDSTFTFSGNGTYAYSSSSYYEPCNVNSNGAYTAKNDGTGLYLKRGIHQMSMVYPALPTVTYENEPVIKISRTYSNSNLIPYISNHYEMNVTGYDNIFNLDGLELMDRRCQVTFYMNQTIGKDLYVPSIYLKDIAGSGNFSTLSQKYVYFESFLNIGYKSKNYQSGVKTLIEGNSSSNNTIYLLADDYSDNDANKMYLDIEIDINGIRRHKIVDFKYKLEPQKSYNIIINIPDLDSKPIFTIYCDDWEIGVTQGSNDLIIN